MNQKDRNKRINTLESQRRSRGSNIGLTSPWTDEEKSQLLDVSCIGSDFDWDCKIYTYVKYEYFEKYWMSKDPKKWKINFSNPKNFRDPYDSLIRKVPIKDGNILVSQAPILQEVYISCWTKCKESELHWNAYGRCNKSVCLVSTPRKIMENIYDFDLKGSYLLFFCGNVMYKDINKVKKIIAGTKRCQYGNHDYCAKLLFLKTAEHRSEKEIRFIYFDVANEHNIWNTSPDYASVCVDCNKAFDEIILNPNLKKGKAQRLISKIKNNGFSAAEVKQSTLYDNPYTYIKWL